MRTTKIRNVFIAGFLSFFAPEFASAADVPVKASVAAPVYDWTGWYFGANAGYGGDVLHCAVAFTAFWSRGVNARKACCTRLPS